MIWFDLITPKSVLFFEPIIRELSKDEEIIITSRGDEDYNEVNELLKLKKLKYKSFGGYGGKNLNDKFEASLNRQKKLNEYIEDLGIHILVNLCSVDACRVAFGNGIKIINFCDFPTAKDDKLTHVAKLTLPLSNTIFYPFYIPKEIFLNYCENVIEYDFLDPVIYLQSQNKDKSFFNGLNLDKNKKTILYREEEHKSGYVSEQKTFIEKILKDIDVNLIVIPRYEYLIVKKKFPNAIVLKEKIELSNILPFVDLFIGGGGTINIESVYWGIPTISTRSFLCHYDRYLIDNNLMFHIKKEEEFLEVFNKIDTLKLNTNKINRIVNVENLTKLIKKVNHEKI